MCCEVKYFVMQSEAGYSWEKMVPSLAQDADQGGLLQCEGFQYEIIFPFAKGTGPRCPRTHAGVREFAA